MMTQNTKTRYELRNRYVFTGKLEMQTALHIGGGKITLSSSDSPIVLTPENKPFIPGSSFKGALRSIVEKVVASLPADTGLRSCGLPTQEDKSPTSCPTTRQSSIVKLKREYAGNVEDIMAQVYDQLCHTCQLFGSPFAAAHIMVNDLYLTEDGWSGITQIRDGVAIDRDSETAKSGLKYDFEVVPTTTTFALQIILENATPTDLQLISIGLSEFVNGFGGIGGKRSRGLGACILTDLKISYLDLETGSVQERRQQLQQYLLKRKLSVVDSYQTFFEMHINAIFENSSTAQ